MEDFGVDESDRIRLKSVFVLAAFVFFSSLLLGYSVATFLNVNPFRDVLQEFSQSFSERSPFSLMSFIFLNNALKAALVVILGIFIGIFPVFFLFVNGLVIGSVIFEAQEMAGWQFVAYAILPHGVIEIPAILLASALGLRIGAEALNRITHKNSRIRANIKRGLRLLLTRIIPALLAAAFVEAFVTSALLKLLMR